MYNAFDSKQKIAYLSSLSVILQNQISLLERVQLLPLSPAGVAGYQAALRSQVPGRVAALERSEQVWVEGWLKQHACWDIISSNDRLATEAGMVDFNYALTREIERQLFISGGSEELLTLLTMLRDIYATYYQPLKTMSATSNVVTKVMTALNQELNVKELDPHHHQYIGSVLSGAKSVHEVNSVLRNLLNHTQSELVNLRKVEMAAKSAKITGRLNAQ